MLQRCLKTHLALCRQKTWVAYISPLHRFSSLLPAIDQRKQEVRWFLDDVSTLTSPLWNNNQTPFLCSLPITLINTHECGLWCLYLQKGSCCAGVSMQPPLFCTRNHYSASTRLNEPIKAALFMLN